MRRELVPDEDPDRARAVGLDARGKSTVMYALFEAPDDTAAYQHLRGADQLAETADRSYLFTDPDTAVAELRALEKLGITYVILRMQWFDLDQDRMLRTLELFANRVLPALG